MGRVLVLLLTAVGIAEALRHPRVRGLSALRASSMDVNAAHTAQVLAAKEAEYNARRAATTATKDDAAVCSLASLTKHAYVDPETGLVSDVGREGARASVFAVSDAEDVVQYIGISRSVHQSLLLILGRCPELCHFVRVEHIDKPSRATLEAIRRGWITELGALPPGNEASEGGSPWEGPLDVRPLMTPDEETELHAASASGREASVLKAVCRRLEASKVHALKARNVRESLRFDPKLKAQGLLDLLVA